MDVTMEAYRADMNDEFLNAVALGLIEESPQNKHTMGKNDGNT